MLISEEKMEHIFLISIISIILLIETLYFYKKNIISFKSIVVNVLCILIAYLFKIFIMKDIYMDIIEIILGLYTIMFSYICKKKNK